MCPQSCLTQMETPSRYCNTIPDEHGVHDSLRAVRQFPSGHSYQPVHAPPCCATHLQHISNTTNSLNNLLVTNMNHFKRVLYFLYM